ncbi:MAG: hypothetical protein R3B57_07215 [Phycisphaerales bacterium]
MDESVEHTDGPRLSPEDAAALDALMSGTTGSRDERVARLEGLMALLGTPSADEPADGSLVDLTYLRVMRAAEAPVLDEDVLAPTCADALDSWVHSGYDASRTPAVFREHAIQHQRLAALATAPVMGERRGREQLIESTLARVQGDIDKSEANLSTERWRSRGPLRLTDIVSIAAMLLLSTAIILPVASSVREGQRRTVCNSNLAGVGGALGMYAMSNASSLPMATAGVSPRWMDVGETPESSNSANLYVLVRTNHVSLEKLACPGNPQAPTVQLAADQRDWRRLEEVSYSYRISPWNQRLRWGDSGGRVIMADRSPVVLKVAMGEPIVPEANSPNHAAEGEHLLSSDGSVEWVSTPVVEGDNIWLPRVIEKQIETARRSRGLIHGDERPTTPDDVFLAP